MTVPNSNITILKNGIGVAGSTAKAILVLAPGSSTTSSGVIKQIASTQTALDLYGYTPIAEMASYIAKYAGSCYALDLPAVQTELSDQALTITGTGSEPITIDGYATMDYKISINILDGYKYNFSLDDGLTTSKTRRIVSAGSSFVLPGTGLTITFDTKENYVAGDIHSIDVTGPKLAASDLTAAFTTIKNYATPFYAVVVYDGLKTASNSATLFTALDAELDSCEANKYYLSGIIGFGELSTVSDTQDALEDVVSNRIQVVPATCVPYSALSREGYTGLTQSLIYPYVSRLARCLISEDPGQVDRGALDGVVTIFNDEALNGTFDDWQGVTARKFRGKTGWYITNSWMKGDPGEDVQYIQHRRVMDVACAVTYATSVNFIKRPTRTNKDGTIFEVDAVTYEGQIESAITSALKNATNSAGTKGHISNFKYAIDRTTNLLQTKTIYATLSIQPLGYPDWIETTISFVATLA